MGFATAGIISEVRMITKNRALRFAFNMYFKCYYY